MSASSTVTKPRSTNPIPQGFHTTTAHLVCQDARAAIAFYKQAFNAEELCVMPTPDGKVMHAMIRIGDSFVMLGEECPQFGVLSPKSVGHSTTTIHLYVEDADRIFNQAVAAGGVPIMPITDMFWGDRYGKIADPAGHHWAIATHIEDVEPEEAARRAAVACAEMAKQMAQQK